MTAARLILALLLLSLLPAAAAREPVTVGFRWEYRHFEPVVELFEIDGRVRLWETKSVKTLADAPVGAPITGSAITLTPGRNMRFALVVRNDSAEPLYFFAAPHVVNPVENALGFKFKCLCINHAFSVGAGEVWYRVVEFRLSADFVGDALTVTHSIIGIGRERAKAFALERRPSDF